MTVEIHPVQRSSNPNRDGKVSSLVTLRAYEVYAAIHGAQPALVDLAGRGCRGGFSSGEIIGFLYAYPFPKAEWRARCEEAWAGMENL